MTYIEERTERIRNLRLKYPMLEKYYRVSELLISLILLDSDDTFIDKQFEELEEILKNETIK